MDNVNNFDQILQAYIAQILKIQQEKNQEPLKLEELSQVAGNLGLSQADLDLIDEKFRGFLQRGLGYARYQNWDKAIEELQQAVNIKPLHVEALFGLADAFRNRWLEKGKKTDQHQALLYAERCLQYQYNHEGSLYLISQMRTARPRRRAWQAYSRLITYTLMSLSLILLAYLAWQLIDNQNITKIIDKSKNTEKTILKNEDLAIPIEITQDKKSLGLDLDVESSFIRPIDEGYLYNVRACISNKTKEIQSLSMKLDLLDEKNQVIYSENLDLLDENAFELRPNDALPISKILQEREISKSVKKAHLTVLAIQQNLVKEDYEPANKVDLTWEIKKSSEINLDIRERYQTIKPQAEIFAHNLVLEYKNTGKIPVKNLQILIKWFDLKDKLVHEEIAELVNANEPKLKVGQRRSRSFNYIIDLKRADYQQYKVFVLAVN